MQSPCLFWLERCYDDHRRPCHDFVSRFAWRKLMMLLLVIVLLTPGAAFAALAGDLAVPTDAAPLDPPDVSVQPAGELLGMQREIKSLADELFRNLGDADPESGDLSGGVVVCTFVELKRLTRTSSLGRHVAEQMLREVQQRHYGVVELRKGQAVRIDERLGEFGLAREPAEIGQTAAAGAMLTGTYSVVKDGLVLNARIIDNRSGRLLSAATKVLPRNELIDELLSDSATARTAKPAPMYMKRLEL